VTDQAPPQAIEAEEAVLSSVLVSSHALTNIGDSLSPLDFYKQSNQLIYSAALELDRRGIAIDAITVMDQLEKNDALEDAGGRSRLHELVALAGATTNVAHHADIVRENAVRRRLIRCGGEVARLGWQGLGSVDDLLNDAEKLLTGVSENNHRREFAPIDSDLTDLLAGIEEAVAAGRPRLGLPTGFLDLDALTTGLHPGTLTLVAARPAMGKSVFLQNIAEHTAEQGGHAALFNLEMSRQEIQVRSLSRATRLDTKAIRTGRLTPDELAKVRHAAHQLEGRNLYVEDSPSLTVTELRARTRRLQRQVGLNLLGVDYIQLMAPGRGNEENRQQEIATISRSLKILAKELHIPVIAASQLNREVEFRANKRPILSDLRESGSLEQDADLVIFLYRDEYYNPDSESPGIAEVIVAKNRMGANDTVRLAFAGRSSAFRNLAKGLHS
jgi:replicative DNA helicase